MKRGAMKGVALARLAISALTVVCMVLLLQPTQDGAASTATTPPRHTETVRVGMWTLWHDREIKLMDATPGQKILITTCKGCAVLTLAAPVILRASGNSVMVESAGRVRPGNRVNISQAVTLSAHNAAVTLHHPVEFSTRAGALVIAVTLPVEGYVERVVASESGPDDTIESLKALAVVVRSFALHEPHGHADYDLCDSTHCQLLHWAGNANRQRPAHVATLSTAGETLWFHGQRALAYFSKDCGGRTASPAEIWPHALAVAYLTSRIDKYCTAGAGREWASQMTRSDLSATLASHGLARPGWRRLTVARRGESGRAVTLRLDENEISAEDFRLAVGESMGWNQLPSTWFEVNQQGERFYFHGRGWGHGIGLCQKGAAAMAAQNRTAAEILAQYFPGAQRADELSGRGWQRFARNGFMLESLDSADAAFIPALVRARAEAAQRSGLNMSQPVVVRAFASTTAFRNATGAPGWVAAFTEGDWIGVQPLRTLASRRLLDATMHHEFLHALVEHQAGLAAPLWLREGLVELWAESRTIATATPAIETPVIKIDTLDSRLAHASTEADSSVAHRVAAQYASRLVARYGREQVLQWLRSGVPAGVVAALGQR